MVPVIQEAFNLFYKVVLQVWHLPYDSQGTQCGLILIVSNGKGRKRSRPTFLPNVTIT